ncbi:unnamed protein product [Sphagnum tenellum]
MEGKALLLVASALRTKGGGRGPGRNALPCELRVQPEVQARTVCDKFGKESESRVVTSPTALASYIANETGRLMQEGARALQARIACDKFGTESTSRAAVISPTA